MASATDYYPGGMMMPGRNVQYAWARMGYNGQEKVDEIAGVGNHNTALFWEYSTQINWRWNLDPVIKAEQSPYTVFDGNPIWKNDPLGNTPPKDPNTYETNTKTGSYTKVDDKGGDKTDYIRETTPAQETPFGTLPERKREYAVDVQNSTVAGQPGLSLRYPGHNVTGSIWSGKAEFVDDPITSLGPGLIEYAGKQAVGYTAEKLFTASISNRVFWRVVKLQKAKLLISQNKLEE